MPGLIKPPNQAVNPALADHKWVWFWEAVNVPLIFNDRQVARIVNPKFPQQTWATGGAAGQDASVDFGLQGQFLTSERSADNYGLLDAVGSPGSVTNGQSFFFGVADLGSDPRFGGAIAGGNANYQLRVNTSGKPDIFQATSLRHTSTSAVPATGPFTLGYYVANSGSPSHEIYIDGEFDSSKTDAGWGNIGNITSLFGVVNQSSRVDLKLYCFYQFNDTQLTAAQWKQLHDDPFGPFRMFDEVGVVVGVATGDPTPVIIGHLATLSQGTTQINLDSIAALAGHLATLTQGTITPAIIKTIVGHLADLQQGAIQINLDSIAAIAGHLTTLTQGTITPAIITALIGHVATLSQGTIITLADILAALTGHVATLSQGTIITLADILAALTGHVATLSQGTITPTIVSDLIGHLADLQQGTTQINLDSIAALTGHLADLQQGIITPAIALDLTGHLSTLAQGTLLANIIADLIGHTANLQQGTIQINLDSVATIIGHLADLQQGNIILSLGDIVKILTGHLATLSQGTFVPTLITPISNNLLDLEQGIFVTSLLSTEIWIEVPNSDPSIWVSK